MQSVQFSFQPAFNADGFPEGTSMTMYMPGNPPVSLSSADDQPLLYVTYDPNENTHNTFHPEVSLYHKGSPSSPCKIGDVNNTTLTITRKPAFIIPIVYKNDATGTMGQRVFVHIPSENNRTLVVGHEDSLQVDGQTVDATPKSMNISICYRGKKLSCALGGAGLCMQATGIEGKLDSSKLLLDLETGKVTFNGPAPPFTGPWAKKLTLGVSSAFVDSSGTTSRTQVTIDMPGLRNGPLQLQSDPSNDVSQTPVIDIPEITKATAQNFFKDGITIKDRNGKVVQQGPAFLLPVMWTEASTGNKGQRVYAFFYVTETFHLLSVYDTLIINGKTVNHYSHSANVQTHNDKDKEKTLLTLLTQIAKPLKDGSPGEQWWYPKQGIVYFPGNPNNQGPPPPSKPMPGPGGDDTGGDEPGLSTGVIIAIVVTVLVVIASIVIFFVVRANQSEEDGAADDVESSQPISAE